MAQPSVAHYFNTRKRPALDDHKADIPKKVLILDQNTDGAAKLPQEVVGRTKIASLEGQNVAKKVIRVAKTKKVKECSQSIRNFLDNMKVPERCVTPPNAVEDRSKDLLEIKKKLSKSSRLNELKESINRFKKSAELLDAAEQRTKVAQSPKLKSFKALEFEVIVSPQKTQSPEKAYLSPKKESNVRRNLLSTFSPTKNIAALISENVPKEVLTATTKQGLKLPFKYRTLAEIFRALDTVSQILYNRKETITLQKLKPAVEEMLKRNLTQKHLAQIKFIYPEAYEYRQEKLKQFGMRHEEWNLVVKPNIGTAESMTSEIVLYRRRKLYDTLIDLVKKYHNEFLQTLTPPLTIRNDKIMRWHPEFDIERVPDIELSQIPQAPAEEKFTTGKEMLEKARQIFNCNTRMEQAIDKLKAAREAAPMTQESPTEPMSILKGIPKALLEKVRQRQAAKALMSMTRSVDKDKEVQLYSRLPEIARLTRNVFVTERKSVLTLETVVKKLEDSYQCFLTTPEMEDHLKTISKEIPKWLQFIEKRGSVFLKLDKNADLSVVISKLGKLAKEKSES